MHDSQSNASVKFLYITADRCTPSLPNICKGLFIKRRCRQNIIFLLFISPSNTGSMLLITFRLSSYICGEIFLGLILIKSSQTTPTCTHSNFPSVSMSSEMLHATFSGLADAYQMSFPPICSIVIVVWKNVCSSADLGLKANFPLALRLFQTIEFRTERG